MKKLLFQDLTKEIQEAFLRGMDKLNDEELTQEVRILEKLPTY